MDWTPGGLSDDVEDRRGSSGGGGLGIVGFLFLVIISLVTGRNYIGSYLSGGGRVQTQAARGPVAASPQEERSAQLVSFVLDDVQHTWTAMLPEQTGRNYRHAKLVLSGNDPSQKNHLSVDMELQADCLAGVWAHSTAQRKIIDAADVSAGLQAAAAVGDDHIQKMERGAVSPESFTHGTSAQRTGWFKRGLQQGTVAACNTFSAGAGSSF